MMRCLKFVSLIALSALAACHGNPYRKLATQKISSPSALTSKPKISRELYRCAVDGRFLFKRFHLSGILFFKQLGDGSARVVFQNELGLAFFDFAWNARDSFSVKSVIHQLDRPAVIKTLQTDLSLLLMKGLSAHEEAFLIADSDTLSRFPVNSGYVYYKQRRGRITGIEYSGHSRITSIKLEGKGKRAELPSSITFTHHKTHFSIVLRKLSQDDQ